MIIAEVYIHLRSEANIREEQERFGAALNEYALDAARRFLEDCTIEVIVDEGSTKAKVLVRRTLNTLILIYGLTADFDSFCKQVGTAWSNTTWFMQTVAQRVQYGEVPGTTYDRRIEKRHKTTGKLKQVAEMVLELNDVKHLLTAEQFREKTDALISKLGEIQREVSEDEMRHLLKALSLETFHGAPTKEPIDLFRSPHLLQRPRTEEEEYNDMIAELAQDDDHIGETRIAPIPGRIYERYTHVPKEEPETKASIEIKPRPSLYPPTRQIDLD
ncbi:hypothetical protein [Bradyrhizobium sp. AZCC 1578]|uniref:hypothetical protein n=1 Tax=Bradyrhizobium sp. AZCC 1578 TaxID=3117027 RepID=UPI002FF3163C